MAVWCLAPCQGKPGHTCGVALISTSRGSPGAEWQQPRVLLVAFGATLGFGSGNYPHTLQVIVQGVIIFLSLLWLVQDLKIKELIWPGRVQAIHSENQVTLQ